MVRNVDDLDFCLQSHPQSILEGLNSLRSHPKLSDVTLSVAGREFHCHRSVLALCSLYFHSMFSGDFVESIAARVELRDVDPDMLDTILDFAYTGKLTINQGNVEGLIRTSSQLQFATVRKVCSRYLQHQIDATNCLGILKFGEMHGCPEVVAKARGFLLENFEAVAQGEEFLLLEKEGLAACLEEERLQMREEKTRVEAALRWVRHNEDTRATHLPKLLGLVRLSLLSQEYITETLLKDRLVLETPACREAVERNRRGTDPGALSQGGARCPPPSLQEVLFVIGGRSADDSDDDDDEEEEEEDEEGQPRSVHRNAAFYNTKTTLVAVGNRADASALGVSTPRRSVHTPRCSVHAPRRLGARRSALQRLDARCMLLNARRSVHAPQRSTLQRFDARCTHLDARRFGARRVDASTLGAHSSMLGARTSTIRRATLGASTPRCSVHAPQRSTLGARTSTLNASALRRSVHAPRRSTLGARRTFDGASEAGLASFPLVDAAFAALVKTPTLSGLTKDPACPNKQCRTTKIHLKKGYSAATEAVRLSNIASLLTVYQAALLRDLPECPSAALRSELGTLSQLLVKLAQLNARAQGRSIASMVVARRQLWLSQARVQEPDKAPLLDDPITPGHTFGPAVEEMLQRSVKAREASLQIAKMWPNKQFQPKRPQEQPWRRTSPQQQAQPRGQWNQIPDFPDYNKWGFSVVSLNNNVYVTGGSRGSRTNTWSTTQTWKYDSQQGKWTTVAPMLRPRTNHTTAVLNGEIYAIGGTTLDFVEVEHYDPYNDSWSLTGPTVKYVSNFTATGCMGKLYVIGSCAVKYNVLAMQCYNPVIDGWSLIASPFIPKYLSSPCSVSLDGVIYLIGDNTKKVYMYDPDANMWQKVQLLHTLHENGGMVVLGGRLFVTGGHWKGLEGEYRVEMEVYDRGRNSWHMESSLPRLWLYSGSCSIFLDASQWVEPFPVDQT
ncbi:UNVERIFIED_CONTAM: hypothetical protein FKN15_032631 [Acipenser sinensis]